MPPKSIGGCNPDGGDTDCTFFHCQVTSASATVVSQGCNSTDIFVGPRISRPKSCLDL